MSIKFSKVEKLVRRLETIEQQILLILEDLPNAGDECHCELDFGTIFKLVHQGSSFNEVHFYCCKCGGSLSFDR